MQVAKPKKGYKLVKMSFGKYEEIPEEWEVEKLINLCNEKPKYGANYSAIENNTSLPRYVRITDILQDGLLRKDKIASIKEDEAKKYLLKEGDIVFARSGSIGLTYLYKKEDGRCAFAGYLIRFVPNQTKLNTKFLFHYTHSHIYWKWVSSTKTTATISNVNAEQYSKIPIVLPPLPEQKQIASILSNVDDTLQKTNQIIEQTQRLKKGMMQKLLTRGIGHTKFKKIKWLYGKYIEIPEEWDVETVGIITSQITYGLTVRPKFVEDGIPLISSREIRSGKINFIDAPMISEEDFSNLTEKCKGTKNDLFFSKTGTIGHVAIVETLDDFAITQNIASLRPNLNKIVLEFFKWVLLSHYFRKSCFRTINSTTIMDLQLADLGKICVFVPPLPEQKQIASILSNIDTQIQKEKLHKSNLERLKKGLMQKLLTGQIRVKV